jgi:CHAD domain-containing protein
VEAFGARVKDLQTGLGDLNDLATAGPLIASLALPSEAAFAAGELLGRRLAEKPARIRRAGKAFARFADAGAYWN